MRILTRRVRGRRRAPNWATAIVGEVGRTMDQVVKPDLIKKFEAVVADWEHKPEFKARKRITNREIFVYVYPAGEHKMIWRYVSEGTRPHPIVARNAPALVFVWGGKGSYQPKTTPYGTYGGPGTVSGGEVVHFKSVKHPGTDARNFEMHIGKEYRKEFRRQIENAMRRGARRA